MKKYMKKAIFTIISLCLMLSVFTTTNVVIQAKITPNNGLEMDKTVQDNGDGTYTISLEAYATGTKTTISKAKPTDVVLVLDQSGSMKDPIKVKVEHFPIYADGLDDYFEGIYPRSTYYIKSSTGDYIPITTQEKEVVNTIRIPNEHVPGGYVPRNIYYWYDAAGNRYAPLMKDGSDSVKTTHGKNYQAVQFNRRFEERPDGISKVDSLKNAATKFIDNMVADGGDHRVAVVGFADGFHDSADLIDNVVYPSQNYLGTELFIGDKKVSYGSSEIDDNYQFAFQSTQSNVEKLKKSISTLGSVGVTRTDLGIDMANKVLENDPLSAEKGRNKVVIMFTDGAPNDGLASDKDSPEDFKQSVASAVIGGLKTAKDNKTKVYTVGVVESLNPALNPESPTTNLLNKYMQYASSNYPNSTSLKQQGENGNYQAGNFLAATDEESLLKIFEKISEDISSSDVNLDDKTVFKDVVSDYFQLGSAIDVKTYTSKCTGKSAAGFTWEDKKEVTNLPVSISEDKKTIDVTGFNYKEKFVAVNEQTFEPQGEKLIVEVTVSKANGFLGGDNVETNKNTAGIYSDGAMFEAFPEPKVNVGLNFNLQTTDKSVYVGSATNVTTVFDTNKDLGGIQYKAEANQEYTFDGLNNKFVDTIFEVKNKETQELIAKYKIKAGTRELITIQESADLHFLDTTNIEVKVSVLSINNLQNALVVKKDSKINVFTPTIAIEDSSIFLGEATNLNNNIKNVSWSCLDKKAPKPVEAEPILTYTYTSKGTTIFLPEAYRPSETNRYTAQVFNGIVDITDRSVKTKKTAHNDGDFQVQVITGELVIEKEIDKQSSSNETINAEQSFRFKIEVRDEKDGAVRATYYQSIQFSANEGVTKTAITLQGLRKGYYTVSEVSSWSWLFNELAEQRVDNYRGNGSNRGTTENSGVYIGDKTQENTGGKTYFGTAIGTVVDGVEQGNPAKTYFKNTKLATSIIADAATAINQFKNR